VVDWSGKLFRSTLDLFTLYDYFLFRKGNYIEAHVKPTMEVNVMPWHLAYN
jgi:hypothetical protein